jgi:acetylornithine deacetylase
MPTLSGPERRVSDHIAAGEPELVELTCRLVGFDTASREAERSGGDIEGLQRYLARRLGSRGVPVELAEPPAALVAGHAYVPPGFDFAGRPQLVARLSGAGGGPSLLLNGHIDVVSAEPRAAWSSDPFAAEVRDGAVFGRGACDMKGGVAAMVFAAEALQALEVPLAGDLIVNTVSEEETTGAGGLVTARTLQADAAIVPEPTGLAVATCCRGSLLASIDVQGRAGHAGTAPRHHDDGGAVNAIDKAAYLLGALRRLNAEWALRDGHPHLSPPHAVVTAVHGGEWIVSVPARCRIDVHIEFLPGQADADGWGAAVESEFERWVASAAQADPWLREHPPEVRWRQGGVPAAEVAEDEPVVQTLLGAQATLGRRARAGGLDNWSDAATLVTEAAIPAVCFGPGDLRLAHGPDEHVPIADLVACAQAIAVTAMRFCRVAP